MRHSSQPAGDEQGDSLLLWLRGLLWLLPLLGLGRLQLLLEKRCFEPAEGQAAGPGR